MAKACIVISMLIYNGNIVFPFAELYFIFSFKYDIEHRYLTLCSLLHSFQILIIFVYLCVFAYTPPRLIHLDSCTVTVRWLYYRRIELRFIHIKNKINLGLIKRAHERQSAIVNKVIRLQQKASAFSTRSLCRKHFNIRL